MTIPRENGTDFIDQNGHRMTRRFPLLPLVRAVQTFTTYKIKVASKFDRFSVDFVADHNRLSCLHGQTTNPTFGASTLNSREIGTSL